jgi:hypothetical protein
MKKADFLVLLKRLLVFMAVIMVAYVIENALPWIMVLSSVSWNLASL